MQERRGVWMMWCWFSHARPLRCFGGVYFYYPRLNQPFKHTHTHSNRTACHLAWWGTSHCFLCNNLASFICPSLKLAISLLNFKKLWRVCLFYTPHFPSVPFFLNHFLSFPTLLPFHLSFYLIRTRVITPSSRSIKFPILFTRASIGLYRPCCLHLVRVIGLMAYVHAHATHKIYTCANSHKRG